MNKTPLSIDMQQAVERVAANMHKAGFDSVTNISVAWIEALGDVNAEVARFLAQRIKEDVDTQHRMLHCKSVKDFQHLQMEFLQTAMKQYEESAARLFDIATHGLSGREPEKA